MAVETLPDWTSLYTHGAKVLLWKMPQIKAEAPVLGRQFFKVVLIVLCNGKIN